jgi:hypothetical protein
MPKKESKEASKRDRKPSDSVNKDADLESSVRGSDAQSSYSDESSNSSASASNRRHERPRFDSKASWADSTRFDRADSRASELSSRDLRLTQVSNGPKGNRQRSDSKASRASRSSRIHSRSRNSSFGSNYGLGFKDRKDTNALSTITENWNLADDQFGSPFSDFDAHGTLSPIFTIVSHLINNTFCLI